MSVRITGGKMKGVRLASPGAGGGRHRLRPTTGRTRAAIFDMLIHSDIGDCVSGARALDLFAGTGAMGLEALSRGAASVAFVERDGRACELIRKNVKLLGVASSTTIYRCDATALPPARQPPCNLAFLDPPYGRGLAAAAIAAALGKRWIEAGCVFVVEESEPMPNGGQFEFLSHRRYGSTSISIGTIRETSPRCDSHG